MLLTLQIGVGIWIGGLMLFASIAIGAEMNKQIEVIRRKRRMGFTWRHALGVR